MRLKKLEKYYQSFLEQQTPMEDSVVRLEVRSRGVVRLEVRSRGVVRRR